MDPILHQYLLQSKTILGLPTLSLQMRELNHHSPSECFKESAYASNTVYKAGSLSKLITAIAILRLVSQQKLGLDAPISDYLPWLKNNQWTQYQAPEATVLDLLSHTANLPRGMYLDARPSIQQICVDLSHWRLSTNDSESSSSTKYSNLGYVLLGFIVETVTETTYEEFVNKQIFVPLGMESSGFQTPDPQLTFAPPHQLSCFKKTNTSPFNYEPRPLVATPPSSSDLHSCTSDLMQLLSCLLAGGTWQGYQLLPQEQVHFLWSQHHCIGHGVSRGMGLLFARSGMGNLQFEAAEHLGHSAVIYMVPDKAFALIALCNRASASDTLLHMCNSIARFTLRQLPPSALSYTPHNSQALSGDYYSIGGHKLCIRQKGNVLEGRLDSETWSQILALGNQGLLIQGGSLAKYPLKTDGTGIGCGQSIDRINAGPYQFTRSSVPKGPIASNQFEHPLAGIYRNNTLGRIAVYLRNRELYLAYSPFKEARLTPTGQQQYQQSDGPFAGETINFDATKKRLILPTHTFDKTTETY